MPMRISSGRSWDARWSSLLRAVSWTLDPGSKSSMESLMADDKSEFSLRSLANRTQRSDPAADPIADPGYRNVANDRPGQRPAPGCVLRGSEGREVDSAAVAALYEAVKKAGMIRAGRFPSLHHRKEG